MAYLWVKDSIGIEYLLMVPDSLPYKHTQVKCTYSNKITYCINHNVFIIEIPMYRNLSVDFFFPILTTIKTLSEAQMAHTGSSVPYKK